MASSSKMIWVRTRAGDVFSAARVLHLEFGAFLDHRGQVIECHIAGGLGVVETPVGVFLDDDRPFGLAFSSDT